MKATILWKQPLNHCVACRHLHRSRSKPGKEDLPLCDKLEIEGAPPGCERIRNWQDTKGGIHHEPIKLMPENYLILDLYDRAIELGTLQKYEYQKGDQIKTKYYANLDMLDFVLKYYLAEDSLSVDEFNTIIESIGLIHGLKLENLMVD